MQIYASNHSIVSKALTQAFHFITKLSTDHFCIILIPRGCTTHSAIRIVQANLHSALELIRAISQSNNPISACCRILCRVHESMYIGVQLLEAQFKYK